MRQTVNAVGTGIPYGGEFKRRDIGGQPLLYCKQLLSTGYVGPRCGHLHVITVPAVVVARSVGSEVQGARRRGQARRSPAENVQIAPLVVVVPRLHYPSPGLQVRDLDIPAVGVVEA